MEPSGIDETLSEEERRNGQKKSRPLNIWQPLERLNPVRRARGIFWGPTRAIYDAWRRTRK